MKVALVAIPLAAILAGPCRAVDATCSEPTGSVNDPVELSASVSTARLAALRLWAATDGASSAAERCEEIMWRSFGRLVALKTDAASKSAAALLMDPALSWHAGDALLAADRVAHLGGLVWPYLEPHSRTSHLAEFTLKCIAEARRTCL